MALTSFFLNFAFRLFIIGLIVTLNRDSGIKKVNKQT